VIVALKCWLSCTQQITFSRKKGTMAEWQTKRKRFSLDELVESKLLAVDTEVWCTKRHKAVVTRVERKQGTRHGLMCMVNHWIQLDGLPHS
jgi:hypothetical protein